MKRNITPDKIYMLESKLHQNFTSAESIPCDQKPDHKNAKAYLKAVCSWIS